MPYEWLTAAQKAPGQAGAAAGDAAVPLAELHLWPYRSLPRRGFVVFIAVTAAMISLPVIGLLGTAALWGLLPFVIAAVAGVGWAIERSYRDGAILERLCLWPDRMTLTRQDPRRPPRSWEANPHWVRLHLTPAGGPVPQYLTLQGGPREVELGAFLSEAERLTLRDELAGRLAALH